MSAAIDPSGFRIAPSILSADFARLGEEVRRVLEHFGLKVSRLIRIGYVPFALDELPKGAAVEIDAKVLDRFRREIDRAKG